MTRPDREPWFAVRRSPGKISAVPVHPKGWVALVGFIAGMVVVAALLMPLTRGWHPLLVVPVMLVAMTAALLAFMRWVVIPRGQSAAE